MNEPAPVLQARALVKVFGQHHALRGLDLAVPKGMIYGLLGPNGAGKSTTLRCVLGLIRPTSGEVRLFGEPLQSKRLELLRRVGCLVEGPTFYPYLSGLDNLRWLGRLAGGASEERVQTCLEWVGLAQRGKDRFKGYSTGMRQRLGLAGAILHDPEFLVLDEPLNGLDPPAIVLVRDLIRRLAKEGKTILISSHVLHEIELICDRVAILREGQTLAEGAVSDLLDPQGQRVELRATGEVKAVLSASERVERFSAMGEGAWEVELQSPDDCAPLARALIEGSCEVSALIPRKLSLEDLFAELTGGTAEAGYRTDEEVKS